MITTARRFQAIFFVFFLSSHGIDLVKHTSSHLFHLANSAVNSMASRHHHNACSRRQNHHNQTPQIPTSPRCCTFRDSPPCCNHPSPPPDNNNLHHLLASYLQIHQQETHFPNQTCSCNHKNKHDHVVLSCLLQKIDNLESSLNKLAPFHDQRRRDRDRYSTTLRDSAARVIQTHFRSYLVHRSISFRHLKELAVIKSSFLSLKSSVSGKPIFPYKVVSRKATDLLLQLDSIQGRVDPMIRNSKRSLSRDLVGFLHYVDDCVVRRYDDFVSRSAVNVGRGCDGKRVEKLRNRMGKVFVSCEELDSTTDDSEEEVSVDKRKKTESSSILKGNPVRRTMVSGKDRNVYQVYGGNKHNLTSSAEDDDSVGSGEEETLVVSRDNERKHGSRSRNMVLVKGGGGKSRVVKTVRFDENGNVYKVYGDTPEASISEEGDDDSTSGSKDGDGGKKGSGNEVVEIKYVPKENEGFEEEEEEETQSENEVSSSDSSERNARDANEEKKREMEVKKGSLMYTPPLPLKMEP